MTNFKDKEEMNKYIKSQLDIAIFGFFVEHQQNIRKQVYRDIKKDIDSGTIEIQIGNRLGAQIDSFRDQMITWFETLQEEISDFRYSLASLEGRLERIIEMLELKENFNDDLDNGDDWERTDKVLERKKKLKE